MRVSPVSFGGLSILESSNKGINSTRHCPRSPVGQNTCHQESLAPGLSLQRGPSAAAASSHALQGSRCSGDRPEAPSSPNGLVTPGPPCSRGADGPIWVALMPPLRTARWFGPLSSLCSPTSPAPAAKGSASHAQCFPERERRGYVRGSAFCGPRPAPLGWWLAKRCLPALEP